MKEKFLNIKFLKILFFIFLFIYTFVILSRSPNSVQLEFFLIVFSVSLIVVIYAKIFKKESEYIKLFLIFTALFFKKADLTMT